MTNKGHSLAILDLLIKRQEERISELLSVDDISMLLGLDYETVDEHVRILDAQGALKSNRALDGSASPMLLDGGYLLRSQLKAEETDYVPENHSKFSHSHDYRSVTWNDKHFTFNYSQSLCIEILHRNLMKGVPWVTSGEIIRYLELNGRSNNRIGSVFVNHPALGTMIVRDESKRGMYRLDSDDLG